MSADGPVAGGGRPLDAPPPGTERVAILDPFSGIAGDMTLGALVAVGLDADWVRALPAALGLDGVTVDVRHVQRAGIGCVKVDFAIPPQPHGRHVHQIRALVARAGVVPAAVRDRADRVFQLIAEQEAEIHGTTVERVHLHEVGAVDAILDVVGSVWGLAVLGVDCVYANPLQVGDGFVRAAHGVLPVPAPATLRILEGLRVRPGPDGAGELVTPTGAALVRVLAEGGVPAEYVPRRSGFGAGTKEFADRANALRIVLADVRRGAAVGAPAVAGEERGRREPLVVLSADVDDMAPEYVAAAADELRAAGALDVVLLPTVMKKGRLATRLEALVRPDDADALERLMLAATTTLGVRRQHLERRAIARARHAVLVDGHTVHVKTSTPPGAPSRAKPEFDDVRRAAEALGVPAWTVAERVRGVVTDGERDRNPTLGPEAKS